MFAFDILTTFEHISQAFSKAQHYGDACAKNLIHSHKNIPR